MVSLRVWLVCSWCFTGALLQAEDFIPRRQEKPPGPAATPQEAIKKMVVPEGFQVELVAAEPDIVNPVAMTFDERGRVWVTESFEYPRREPGPSRDRIKVLNDKDGDGTAETVTIFAEGLNIPSGIAVGHGGVWVANAPDILFMQDTNGDGKADKTEVVVTGFGRTDTHELPNSLTWGPDGWLYGINGVFNFSHVKYRGKEYRFTCALFRIHPKTRDFELFAEGTSNPWGVAWDNEGSAFFSACVIDHLWHITESGYYHRQGGPYPPFTWKIESIVKHKHQLAAYCGIHFFDSDAYPEKYRNKLYMGNIHGNCLNCDFLERDGSTYFAKPDPDFLTANDVWFMPVVQKTGPDGSLYVLDWYDRYHCYQDANRDPAGIDRLHGRLYRIRYQNTPRKFGFDLSKETDDQLLQHLHSPNVYFRDIAQRILCERLLADGDHAATKGKLEALVLDNGAPRKARMHGLWSLVGGGKLNEDFHLKLLKHEDGGFRAWSVRAAGNMKQVPEAVKTHVVSVASHDTFPDVRLQTAIAARKVQGVEPISLLTQVLVNSADDKLIPHIVWQNLQPLLEDHSEDFLALVEQNNWQSSPGLQKIYPMLIERILARKNPETTPVVSLLSLTASGKKPNLAAAQQCLAALAGKIQTKELSGPRLQALRPKLEPVLQQIFAKGAEHPLYLDSALLATTWGEKQALQAVRQVLSAGKVPTPRRLQALDALVAARDAELLPTMSDILSHPQQHSADFRAAALAALSRLDQPEVAALVLQQYAQLEADLQPKAVELLTQRPAWSRALLAAIAAKQVPANALNVNQVRQLLASKDPELVKLVTAQWGTVRTDRNPQREQVIADMRQLIRSGRGDPHRGVEVFKKLCGQCHKIYGEGQEVGPDITRNGRNSFEQLLSNVFDPSLVIGASYQARTVQTADGRVLTGLLVEDNDQRVVLKMQGGKLETIARDNIDEMEVSKLSMMPEGVEKQLMPQDIRDLFAYITLDKPPTDPTARQLPGVQVVEPSQTTNPAKFGELIAQIAPGFSTAAVGEGGLGLLADFRGRNNVLRTHPVAQNKPCVLTSSVTLPTGKAARLLLSVSHDPRGDWQLIVKANGKVLHDSLINAANTRDGWAEISVDLTPLAGQSVKLELHNHPNNWAWEFAYWSRMEVVIDP